MTAKPQSTPERKVKTLAIRLDPELHAQLSVIAQLQDNSLADEIRQALSAHVAAQAANPDLAGAAGGLLEDIEQEAAARRDALSTLFGDGGGTSAKSARRSSGKRSTGTSSSTDS